MVEMDPSCELRTTCRPGSDDDLDARRSESFLFTSFACGEVNRPGLRGKPVRFSTPSPGAYYSDICRPITQTVEDDTKMTQLLTSLEGTLVRVEGPRPSTTSPDPWRSAFKATAPIAILPLAAAILILRSSVSLAKLLLGFGSKRGGRSLLDEIAFLRVLELLTREATPTPCYQWYIRTRHGLRIARQEGEFSNSMPTVGHKVRVSGSVRQNVLLIKSGRDETANIDFALRPSAYRTPFLLSLLVIILFGAAPGLLISLE